MTVSTTTNKQSYTGNGVTTLFGFPIPFIAASDLLVYVGGVLKTLTTDYTISGSAPYPAGANVTFVAAPANLAAILIVRSRPYTQTLDLVANDPLPADTVEQLLGDHMVMLIQQLKEITDRSFSLPITDTSGASTTIPTPAASQFLGWNSAGTALQNYAGVAGIAISAAMTPVVQAATLALARTAMAVAGLADNNAFSGTNTVTTQTPLTNNTRIASTAYADAAVAAVASATAPTYQSLTSGSGTYNRPAGVKWLRIRMSGGGGGAGGGGTNNTGGTGGTGGTTTFGTSLLSAVGGTGGSCAGSGGVGGTASITGPAIGLSPPQSGYGSCAGVANGGSYGLGGAGGQNAFGGCGTGSPSNGGGADARANTGAGGGGGSPNATAQSSGGSGGGAGGYLEAIIPNPSASYSYAVGAAGTAGAAGTSGFAGGQGGSGVIVVEEHYSY